MGLTEDAIKEEGINNPRDDVENTDLMDVTTTQVEGLEDKLDMDIDVVIKQARRNAEAKATNLGADPNTSEGKRAEPSAGNAPTTTEVNQSAMDKGRPRRKGLRKDA